MFGLGQGLVAQAVLVSFTVLVIFLTLMSGNKEWPWLRWMHWGLLPQNGISLRAKNFKESIKTAKEIIFGGQFKIPWDLTTKK
jgi:hypothetical protein